MSLPIFSEVMAVAERLQSRIFSGVDSADAWNEVSVDLVRCAKVNFAKSFNFDEQTSLVFLTSKGQNPLI